MDQIINTEALKAKLATAETTEDVVRILNEEGIPVTADQLVAYATSEDDELSEDFLQNVNGGSIISIIKHGRIYIPWYILKPMPPCPNPFRPDSRKLTFLK